ncbi:MAG: FAD-dependent oxidoreductase [Myxococcota bacterium]
MPQPQPRIGIVGAGPGGLSLARLLTDRGYADVTVLERKEGVGGKSLTWHHEGVPHEMGTCYVAVGYTTTRRWMEQAGMSEHKLKRHAIRRDTGELVDFKEFVLGTAGPVGAAAQITRYVRDWLHFHEWDLLGGPDTFPGTMGGTLVEELAQPFGQWLQARDLDVVWRFAMRTMTIMGYGALDTVPALYGLRWNVPSLLWSAVTLKVSEPVPGWQYLWRHLASQFDVRRAHTITNVERRQGGGFRVHAQRRDEARVVDTALNFDHLVLTGPLDEMAKVYDFSPQERLAFGVDRDTLEWHEYVTTLVDAKGWFQEGDTRSFEANAKDSEAVARHGLLVARRTGDKTKVAQARAQRRPDVYVCYQYGGTVTDEALEDTLRTDLAAEGARDVDVLKLCRWKYAPQLTKKAIAAGGVHRLERTQGDGGLWVTGATASHEAVDNIVDYNERLADRMELAFKGRDPSDPTALAEIAGRYRFKIHDK